MSLIDISYFVNELNVPNTDQAPVMARLTAFIQKYEQEFLRHLLGYPLYKAFITGLATTPPPQRILDILYGKEYISLQGFLTQWRGLIMTDSPVYNFGGQTVYKKPVYITVGVTPGFVANTNIVVPDGTNGTDDWRGWDPILFRGSQPLVPDTDYSWDTDSGTLTLLRANDVWGDAEKLLSLFDARTDSLDSTDTYPAQSPIANYIYCMYRRSAATQTTDFGEVRTTPENSIDQDDNQKIALAWNELHHWVMEFIMFMETNQSLYPTVYPEWQWLFRWEAIRYFEFSNPIF